MSTPSSSTDFPESDMPKVISDSLHIDQAVRGDHNQAIGQVLGGIVVYVSGGQAVFHSSSTESGSSASKPTRSDIGANPYKGLMAFQETDGDRFFGREKQIAAL
ncbi:MAG: hypothetical protein NW224_15860 [Leptolyngbyaceae cyanobacterium bins.302]|nr:hypothetical protein [Leptolyngbyaceae cyanobacterium bins.302]